MERVKHIAGKVISILIVVYGVLVAILYVAQLFLTEEVPVIGIIKSGLHLLLLPSLVLIPLLLVLRQWRLALALVPIFLACIVSYRPYFIPRSKTVPADTQTLNILTFNIQAPETEIDSLINIIRDVNADIVGLQELSHSAAQRFDAELADLYPHRKLHPQDNGHVGQGILSRFPITEDEYWRNQHLEATLGHQRSIIDVNGTSITVFNAHPVPPYAPERGFNAVPHDEEIDILLNRAKDEPNPTILLGDFNMTDQFDDYRRITAEYTDTYREAGTIGFGFSFPNGNRIPLPPILRLDYIFHDSTYTSIEAAVWPESGSSDHAPYWGRLELRNQ